VGSELPEQGTLEPDVIASISVCSVTWLSIASDAHASLASNRPHQLGLLIPRLLVGAGMKLLGSPRRKAYLD